MTNVAERIRGLLSGRRLRAWVAATWLALVLLLAVASLARADDPIERLQRGDLKGFMDDAMRTNWVVAAGTAGASVLLAPALAGALSRTLEDRSERELVELKDAVAKCRQELQPMVQRFDDEKQRLDGAYADLRRTARAMWVYNYIHGCIEGGFILSGVLIIGGTLAAGGAVLTRAMAAFGSRLAQLRNIAAMTARGPASSTLGRLALRAAKARLGEAALALAEAGGIQLAPKLAALTAAGVVIRETAGFMLGSNLRVLQDLRKRLHIGQSKAFEDEFCQLVEQLKQEALELGEFGERVHRHNQHCEALAAELQRISGGHQRTLSSTRDAVQEAWRRAREAETQPTVPPDSTSPPEGG